MNLESVSLAPGFAAARFGPLHLSIWEAPATVAQATIAIETLSAIGRTEDRVLVMAVLGPNTPPPDNAVRDLFAKEFSRLGSRVAAVANVIEGQGFRAATMRAVVTGLTLVIRAGHPQKACHSIDIGSDFIAQNSASRLTTEQIARATKELRARI